jgi:hypothetical protein
VKKNVTTRKVSKIKKVTKNKIKQAKKTVAYKENEGYQITEKISPKTTQSKKNNKSCMSRKKYPKDDNLRISKSNESKT